MTALPPPPVCDPASPFQPIPLGHLFPHAAGDFDIFLRHGNNHLLFAHSGEALTADRRALLTEYGVRVVYIHREERDRYRRYQRQHLAEALLGQDLTVEEKSAAFYHNCCDIVRDLIHERLPRELPEASMRWFVAYVRECVTMLCNEVGLAHMGALMAHDYDVYAHGVHVFLYTIFLLRSLRLPVPVIVQAGIGALLHDSGKELVDIAILRKPGRLTPEEFLAIRDHPVHGERLCRPLSLSRLARECILMHHEKLDGQGYPRGLSDEAIPLPVRAVSLSDAYDALTSHRVYAEAVRPFKALRIMRYEMAGSFDLDLFKRFVTLLSGSKLSD